MADRKSKKLSKEVWRMRRNAREFGAALARKPAGSGRYCEKRRRIPVSVWKPRYAHQGLCGPVYRPRGKCTQKPCMTVGSKAQVYRGTARRTAGGLTSADILRLNTGSVTPKGRPIYRYVSRRKSAASEGNSWIAAVQQARAELGVSGFVPVKRGTALYARAKQLHRGGGARTGVLVEL